MLNNCLVVCCALRLLLLVALVSLGSCAARETATVEKDTALAERINGLVDTLLSGDDATKASVLADARAIFEREGVPTVTKVGDAASYGFVLLNMLGQPAEFREQFFPKVQEAATRHELPDDALVFATARRRQKQIEDRYDAHTPSHPELRDQISTLYKDDQAVRQTGASDFKKMVEADRRTAVPLKGIFDRFGVPTYDMVGVRAAKDFVTMVQHQSPEFRSAVLPKLKANVDAGQADPGTYATVYDRTQRDQGKNQLYGEQLECSREKTLEVAPMDDAKNVNIRRSELGLMRLELYARFVRLLSPDMCGAVGSQK